MDFRVLKHTIAIACAVNYVFLASGAEMGIENNKTICDQEPPFIHRHAKYRIVMVRHGQSEANVKDLYGGWYDFDLTSKGVEQAKTAGRILKKRGYKFDIGHTSFLKRASRTLDIILDELGQSSIERYATWRLNERHSGALHGRSHVEVSQEYGEEQVKQWRRAFNVRPPPMTREHPDYGAITKDADRYRQDPEFVDFPPSECMADMIKRVMPYWKGVVVPQVKEGKRILIAAHAGIFRAIIYCLEDFTEEQLRTIKTSNAAPFVYEFDENMKPISSRYYVPVEPAL